MDKLDLVLEKLGTLATEVSGLKSEVSGLKSEVSDLKSETAKINLTIENEIKPQINLLAEGQGELLARLAPRSEVEQLKEEVSFLKAIVKANTRDIEALKKAQ